MGAREAKHVELKQKTKSCGKFQKNGGKSTKKKKKKKKAKYEKKQKKKKAKN